MNKIFATTIWLLLNIPGDAQVIPLQIKDTLPHLEFNQVINYKSSQISINKLKGKAILIDFWNTWCSGCIASLPKMVEIQKRFSSDLQVILVTDESKEKISSFFERRKDLASFKLPMVTSDSILKNLFPHETVPHIIWIDKNGVVREITYPELVTIANVNDFILDRLAPLSIKKDVNLESESPLLSFSPAAREKLLYNSVLTKYIEGSGLSHSLVKLKDGRIKLLSLDASILHLYSNAYRHRIHIGQEIHNRVILNVSNKTLLEVNYRDSTDLLNKTFCYELIVPGKDKEDERNAYQYMRRDLDKYFNLTSTVKTMKRNCYVITIGQPDKIKTYNGKPSIIDHLDFVELHNQPMDVLAIILRNEYKFSLPLLIETPTFSKINTIIKKKFKSFDEVKSFLQNCGLDITVQERQIDMLVLSDK